jgi:hypothetical protein
VQKKVSRLPFASQHRTLPSITRAHVKQSFYPAVGLQIARKVFLGAPHHGDHALQGNSVGRNMQAVAWRPRLIRGVSSHRNGTVPHRTQAEDLPKAAILDSIVRLAMGLQVECIAVGDVVSMKVLHLSIAAYQQVRRSSNQLDGGIDGAAPTAIRTRDELA